ncbi:MAG TPA: 7TM diverse intracellular signaling domain-containing protein, partial [Leptospiraceae bacterium]|nr:7TM diverse intracellular signaling domain-containing protein [Leptospiraceae bacterium]
MFGIKRIFDNHRGRRRERSRPFPTTSLYIILLLATLPLAALDTIDINTCNPNCVIGKNLEILEDKTNLLTIEDIRGMDMAHNDCYDMTQKNANGIDTRKDAINRVSTDTTNPCWKKSESDKPNFGFSSSSYWVKFKVENKKDKPVKYFLELDYAILDYAHFYFKEGGLIKEIILGDMIPFNKRTIANRNPIFEIKINPSDAMNYYMKFKSEGNIILPLTVWKPSSFYTHDHNVQILYGLYFGIFVVMILYNLFLFFSIKDITYIYYVSYLFGGSFSILSINGFVLEYLFENSPILVNSSLLLGLSFGLGSAIIFSMSFLNTKDNIPKMHKLLQLLLGVFLFAIIGSFTLRYSIVIHVVFFGIISSTVTMLITGSISYLRGFRAARFYMIGWSFVLIGMILLFCRGIGLLPTNFITVNGVAIGSALEAILFSLALADRINILKKEKEESQKAL